MFRFRSDHQGNLLNGGVVQFGASGWPVIGTTGDAGLGTIHRELFPGSYSFRMNFNHGSQTRVQDISTPVVFKTGLVDLRFNGIIQHGVSGWPRYTGPTEMLPIEHRFRFTRNDGTSWEARYTPTAGEVLMIQIP